MNFGTLTGYFSNYRIVGTQFHSTWLQNAGNQYSSLTFYAPPEATHALISACAHGSSGANASLFTDPDTYYVSEGGGGGGAACFRVPFNLSMYRYIPAQVQHINGGSVLIGSSITGTDLSAGTIYGNMPAIQLSSGAGGTINFSLASPGGTGGAAIYVNRQSADFTTAITADGGTGGVPGSSNGTNGKVVSVDGGGIIAGGGGGGAGNQLNSGLGRGGSVVSPYGLMIGARGIVSTAGNPIGGGGASLFAPGVSGIWDDVANVMRTSTPIGQRQLFDSNIGGYVYFIPGAGLPGGDTLLNDSSGFMPVISTSFIYCEFIAPME